MELIIHADENLIQDNAVQHVLKILTGGPLRCYSLALLGVIVPDCTMRFEAVCAVGSRASWEFMQR